MSLNATMKCTLFDEQGKCTAVVAVRKALASLSLLGCVFMIFVIWTFSKYRLFVQRLILYLTIAALFDSIGHLMTDIKPEGPLCTFDAFCISLVNWVVLTWVVIITVNMFLNAVITISTEKFEILYGAIVCFISILVACLPFIGNHYGPAGAWCWVQDGDDVWRFAVWYIPLFVLIGVMFIVYSIIVCTVNRQAGLWQGTYNPEQERQRAMLKKYVKPLKAYPLIYLILSIFPLINRLENAFSKSPEPIFALTLLHSVSSPLHGLINAFVYCLDTDLRSRLTWLQIKVALMKKCSATIIAEYQVDESPLEEKPQADQSEITDQPIAVKAEGESADQSRGVVDREPASLTIDVDLPQMDPRVTFSSLQKDSVTTDIDC